MWATLYNCVMAVALATALWSAGRSGRPGTFLLAALAVGGLGTLMAITLSEDLFGAMRLLTYGLFGFVALLCLVAAFVLRCSHRRWAAVFLASFVAIESVAADAFLVEPHWLEISRVRVTTNKLNGPLKIALLADLQTDEIGDYERVVIEAIVAEKPDLILLAGDYIQEHDDHRYVQLQDELQMLLAGSDFRAPLGCYAVRGNVDRSDWADAFLGTGVTAVSKTGSFDLENLTITCLSLHDSFSTNLEVPGTDRFHVVVGHCPNFSLGDVQADLLLAGHCHGGQVRLPILGPLITHALVPRSWAAGVTHLPGDKTLIVSRGVGMERANAPRMRFRCRPELVFIDIVPR
ncbi:MAG TPA: metallophosphoesterase [Pirellulales bacterium]|nr:metallophosphoesterase [Pirellulales bacterium]